MVETSLAANESRAEQAKPSVTVIVPVYNEAPTIAEEVRKIGAVMADVSDLQLLVVDDGSTDGTPELAKEAGARVISHPVNLGQGAAIKTGISNA